MSSPLALTYDDVILDSGLTVSQGSVNALNAQNNLRPNGKRSANADLVIAENEFLDSAVIKSKIGKFFEELKQKLREVCTFFLI